MGTPRVPFARWPGLPRGPTGSPHDQSCGHHPQLARAGSVLASEPPESGALAGRTAGSAVGSLLWSPSRRRCLLACLFPDSALGLPRGPTGVAFTDQDRHRLARMESPDRCPLGASRLSDLAGETAEGTAGAFLWSPPWPRLPSTSAVGLPRRPTRVAFSALAAGHHWPRHGALSEPPMVPMPSLFIPAKRRFSRQGAP